MIRPWWSIPIAAVTGFLLAWNLRNLDAFFMPQRHWERVLSHLDSRIGQSELWASELATEARIARARGEADEAQMLEVLLGEERLRLASGREQRELAWQTYREISAR